MEEQVRDGEREGIRWIAVTITLCSCVDLTLMQNSELKHATDNEFEKTVAEIRDKFA